MKKGQRIARILLWIHYFPIRKKRMRDNNKIVLTTLKITKKSPLYCFVFFWGTLCCLCNSVIIKPWPHTDAKSQFLSKSSILMKSTPTVNLNFRAKNGIIENLIFEQKLIFAAVCGPSKPFFKAMNFITSDLQP